jgi:hypothetical protein
MGIRASDRAGLLKEEAKGEDECDEYEPTIRGGVEGTNRPDGWSAQ